MSHAEDYAAYTDGSKTEGGVGYAVALPDETISRRVSPLSSIFTAELKAIHAAIAYFLRIDRRSFMIVSDSRSALQSACDPFSAHLILAHIQIWLNMLRARQRTVKFC